MAGRPRIYVDQADKQFAYRERQHAKHADALAAWKLVLDAALARGIVSEEETVADQSRYIVQYIEDTFADYIKSS